MSLQRTMRRHFGELTRWKDNSRAVGTATRKALEKARKKGK